MHTRACPGSSRCPGRDLLAAYRLDRPFRIRSAGTTLTVVTPELPCSNGEAVGALVVVRETAGTVVRDASCRSEGGALGVDRSRTIRDAGSRWCRRRCRAAPAARARAQGRSASGRLTCIPPGPPGSAHRGFSDGPGGDHGRGGAVLRGPADGRAGRPPDRSAAERGGRGAGLRKRRRLPRAGRRRTAPTSSACGSWDTGLLRCACRLAGEMARGVRRMWFRLFCRGE